MGLVSTVGNVVLGNPDLPQRDPAIDMLVKALETSDVEQDLRINMDALKLLGEIGEPRIIPTLVKALFIQGKRRQVALQEVARVAIMQSGDLAAMADAMVQAGRMQNEGLNQMQQADPNFDVRLIKEQIAITLGMMGIRSESVVGYLMEELNHEAFDAVDEQPGRGGGSFTKERSRSVRRSFAAQALGKLRHPPALETILGRLVAKKTSEGWAPEDKLVDFEEWPGYLDAAGDFVEPTKTDDAMLPFLVFGDDALLDRTGRRLSLQSSSSKVLDALTKKFGELGPCEEGVKGCVRTNYEKRYLPLIKSGEGCATVDCNAPRLADKAGYVRERAAYQLILAAQDNEAEQARARDELLKAIVVEESDDVLSGLIFAVDRLSPRGCDQACLTKLDDRVAELLTSASGNAARRSLAGLRARLAYRARNAQ
jgi:HEAT repeat protein